MFHGYTAPANSDRFLSFIYMTQYVKLVFLCNLLRINSYTPADLLSTVGYNPLGNHETDLVNYDNIFINRR